MIVSIHAPALGATFIHLLNLPGCYRFNPRTRTGCDSRSFKAIGRSMKFQSTHPHWVRHLPMLKMYLVFLFQSTHPHWVRRVFRLVSYRFSLVSIHAPALGATWLLAGITACPICFNPRTRTGCDTLPCTAASLSSLCFNPRTRTGCDSLLQSTAIPVYLFQSTHPHWVRRWIRRQCLIMAQVSIHAPALGATRKINASKSRPKCFNPRTRTGCDLRSHYL